MRKNLVTLAVSITIIWVLLKAHFESKHAAELAKRTAIIATMEGKLDLAAGASGYSGDYGPVEIPPGAHFVWSVSCSDGTGTADFSVTNPDGTIAELARVQSRYHAEGDVSFPHAGIVNISASSDCPWNAKIIQAQ